MPPSAELPTDGLFTALEPLQPQLNAVVEDLPNLFSREVEIAVDGSIKELEESDILACALGWGDIAPSFQLPDTDGRIVSSDDLLEQGPIVITFFRGYWCPLCSTTLGALRKFAPHIRARGATMIAISPQTVATNKQTQEEADLAFAILSDRQSELTKQLGLTYEVHKPLAKQYIAGGLDMGAIQTEDGDPIMSLPATYIIQKGDDGRPVFTYAFVEPDYTKRAEPMDILAALPELSRESRKSLKYQLELHHAQLLDKALTNQAAKHKLDRMRDFRNSVESSGILETALKRGDTVPPTAASLLDSLVEQRPDGSVKKVSFHKLLKNSSPHHSHGKYAKPRSSSSSIIGNRLLSSSSGPIVLSFLYCTNESFCGVAFESLRRNFDSFRRAGASNVIVVLPNNNIDPTVKATVIAKTSSSSSCPIRILHDTDSRVAADVFGIVHDKQATAATFVIDRDGRTVRFSYVSANLMERAEPSHILAALEEARAAPSKSVVKRGSIGSFSLWAPGWLVSRNNNTPLYQ